MESNLKSNTKDSAVSSVEFLNYIGTTPNFWHDMKDEDGYQKVRVEIGDRYWASVGVSVSASRHVPADDMIAPYWNIEETVTVFFVSNFDDERIEFNQHQSKIVEQYIIENLWKIS